MQWETFRLLLLTVLSRLELEEINIKSQILKKIFEEECQKDTSGIGQEVLSLKADKGICFDEMTQELGGWVRASGDFIYMSERGLDDFQDVPEDKVIRLAEKIISRAKGGVEDESSDKT